MTQGSEGHPGGSAPEGDGDLAGRLDRLGRDLKQRSDADASKHAGQQRTQLGTSGMSRALRLSSEFVAGVIAGALLGWAFDHVLGTTPWGLVVFLLLGFAAGVAELDALCRARLGSGQELNPAERAGHDWQGRRRRWRAEQGLKGTMAGETDPIHQFQIVPLIGNGFFAFTNSAFYMGLTVAIVTSFLLLATSSRTLVPGRWQSLAEMSYEFVAQTMHQTAGREGMRFFPLVFSLFMFILVSNLIGLVPYTFTVASHLIVTFALAMVVILTVVIYGFTKHGAGFLKLFVPHGIPVYILPLVVLIEVISFVSRPISLSVRLFANMLAGHITLKVFAGFVTMLSAGLGAAGLAVGVLPLVMAVAITALEFLVAFLQAYVFTILTCIYLNDALHPGH